MTIKFQRIPSILSSVIALSVCATFCLSLTAQADVGPDQASPGGVIMPNNKSTSIRMKDEKVVFTVKPGSGPFADSTHTAYYAHVTATFTMQNLTDTAVSQNMLFPFHLYYDWGSGDIMQQAKNASVTINNQPAAVTFDNTPLSSSEPQYAYTGHFQTVFAAKSSTTVTVAYDLRGIPLPKSPDIAFKYMMQTGANWADTIGHGEVDFVFDGVKIDSTAPFAAIPSFFRAENGKLSWHFDNLEPTALNDITIAFNPSILTTLWPSRQPFIANITSSTPGIQGGICGNTHSQAPDCYSYVEGGITYGTDPGYLNTAALNVLTPKNKSSESGWLVPFKGSAGTPFNEWVELSFDHPYTFSGVEIRSGFLDTNPDYSHGYSETPGNFYNSFLHAKTVIATLSNGTTTQTTLNDTPGELQTIPLPAVATTSLRLTFADTYPGTYFGNTYFGLGRVYLTGAMQSKTSPAATSSNTAKTNNPLIMYYLIGAVGIVVIGIAAVTVILIRKHRAVKKHNL
jgi:hypothetical protein